MNDAFRFIINCYLSRFGLPVELRSGLLVPPSLLRIPPPDGRSTRGAGDPTDGALPEGRVRILSTSLVCGLFSILAGLLFLSSATLVGLSWITRGLSFTGLVGRLCITGLFDKGL